MHLEKNRKSESSTLHLSQRYGVYPGRGNDKAEQIFHTTEQETVAIRHRHSPAGQCYGGPIQPQNLKAKGKQSKCGFPLKIRRCKRS